MAGGRPAMIPGMVEVNASTLVAAAPLPTPVLPAGLFAANSSAVPPSASTEPAADGAAAAASTEGTPSAVPGSTSTPAPVVSAAAAAAVAAAPAGTSSAAATLDAAAKDKLSDKLVPPKPAVMPEPRKIERPRIWPIFVGNLGFDTSEADVAEAFKEIPEFQGFRINHGVSKATGQTRGFGFAEFSDVLGALKAMEELDGVEVKSRNLRLRWGENCPTTPEVDEFHRRPDRYKTRPCFEFFRGFDCPRKDDCPYAHKDSELRDGNTSRPRQDSSPSRAPAPVRVIENVNDGSVKVPVPFESYEGSTDEEKQRAAYTAVLGAGASHMRFMMKKSGCRLQLRGIGAAASQKEPLHIVIKPGVGVKEVAQERIDLVKKVVDELVNFGRLPEDLPDLPPPVAAPAATPSSSSTAPAPSGGDRKASREDKDDKKSDDGSEADKKDRSRSRSRSGSRSRSRSRSRQGGNRGGRPRSRSRGSRGRTPPRNNKRRRGNRNKNRNRNRPLPSPRRRSRSRGYRGRAASPGGGWRPPHDGGPPTPFGWPGHPYGYPPPGHGPPPPGYPGYPPPGPGYGYPPPGHYPPPGMGPPPPGAGPFGAPLPPQGSVPPSHWHGPPPSAGYP
eukprot:TRINITY_DN2417_c1_g1_i3.p1 TRINITY_DN2417_c1_g1~~TRINITY_DN2417_c1_g1_i3.p1  ORF type:complete len:615 (-),score=132.04 TRINITY_DN2417_c1_g1_i3:74-1918(-)